MIFMVSKADGLNVVRTEVYLGGDTLSEARGARHVF